MCYKFYENFKIKFVIVGQQGKTKIIVYVNYIDFTWFCIEQLFITDANSACYKGYMN